VQATRITGDYIRDRDSVSIATMPDVKGFDFSLVIVIGCGADLLPNPGLCQRESWRDALRLYVAMIRARDEVRLYYSGKPSEFLETMREGLNWEDAPEAWKKALS
jgi:superfamily I DNA/RNA helicase